MVVLFDLLGLTTGITAQFVSYAVAKACLPRMPPPNWIRNSANTKVAFPSQPSYQHAQQPGLTGETRCKRCSQTLQGPVLDFEGYIGVQRFLKEEVPMVTLGSVKIIIPENVPPMTEIPIPRDPFDDSTIQAKFESESDDGDTTLCSIDSPLVDFSIYSDVSSPNLNKAMLISPTRPTMPDVKDVDLTQLRAASDRVSEILRENRRRLDSGEDSNVARKEARRKRAQELSAARKARGCL